MARTLTEAGRSDPPPVQDDPALPHLSMALDPNAMLEVFRMELGPSDGLEHVRIDRVRYRRGARAVLQYILQSTTPGTGESRERWITALMYPLERSRHVWHKLQRSIRTTAEGGEVLPSVARVADPPLILQMFPFDRRLPSLPRLLDPTRLASGLVRSETDSALTWTAHPVRYRAGLGCAVRWDLVDGPEHGPRRWYVKAYRDHQGASTHEALGALRSAGNAIGFTVPEPVVYLAEHRALVQKEVRGRSLADVLLADDDASSVMDRVAEALAAFHRLAPVPVPRRTVYHQLDEIRRAAALVSWVRPGLAESALSVLSLVADGLEDAEPGCTHGDLKPDHIVLTAEGFALLDLDSLSGSDPMADAGSMAARLTGMAVRHPGGAERIEAAREAFADAYLAGVPSEWRRRFAAHHAGALLDEAAGCFRRQVADWPRAMDTLVERAEEALPR